jgi:putative NADH-flavin reductase
MEKLSPTSSFWLQQKAFRLHLLLSYCLRLYQQKKMKILVIGASGKTGRAIVEQAVAAGHEVTAFVHNADKYDIANVRIIEGDATDSTAMEVAVLGQDAVLDTIGGKTPYKETTLETSVASTIIKAMQRNGVRRLVVTSMFGEGDGKANAPIYMHLLAATFLRGASKDKAAMESAVKLSGLDWIILRPGNLTNDPGTGNVRVFDAVTGGKAHKITRADLASFIIAQLTSNKHLHQAVTIANS